VQDESIPRFTTSAAKPKW